MRCWWFCNDTAYLLMRAQWLRRNEKYDEAARALMAAQITPAAVQDPDEWWTERRLLARKLLDLGDTHTVFGLPVTRPCRKRKADGSAALHGWLDCVLNNPAEAKPLFARCAQVAEHPASLSRAHYWQARTAEALGQNGEARGITSAPPVIPRRITDRSRMPGSEAPNCGCLGLRRPTAGTRLEISCARWRCFTVIDERDLVCVRFGRSGHRAADPAQLAAVAALADRKRCTHARASRSHGGQSRPAIRILCLSHGGVAARQADRSAGCRATCRLCHRATGKRVQSAGDLKRKGAGPDAGDAGDRRKLVAKKNGIPFDASRLLEPVYNVQIGSAELGDVLDAYRGSYILAFRSQHNAGAEVGSANGSSGSAIRAIRRSIRSIGSSAYRSRRPATTCSARYGKYAGLPRPLRRLSQADDRGGPAPRSRPELSCEASSDRGAMR